MSAFDGSLSPSFPLLPPSLAWESLYPFSVFYLPGRYSPPFFSGIDFGSGCFTFGVGQQRGKGSLLGTTPHHTLSLWLELRLFGEPRERERELGEININVLSLFYGREGEGAKKYTHTHSAASRRVGLGFGNRDSGIGAAGPPSGGPLCYLLFVF